MLTRESILALKPCRRTNWLIHMKLMGNKAWRFRFGGYTKIKFSPDEPTLPESKFTEIPFEEVNEGRTLVQDVPNYSDDISAAWEVVEKFATFQITKMHDVVLPWSKEEMYRAIIKQNKNVAHAKTAPLAICRAALLTTISGEDSQ